MCTGRVDLAFVLRAFEKGADGVIIGGCWLGECHYVTEGNYDALANMHLVRKLLQQIGVVPERLRIEWISASEGSRFAELMTEFSNELKELGPIGKAEGIDDIVLKRKLDAVTQLVPYMKLVEKDMRVSTKSERAYERFYKSDEFARLFDELIADKLVLSEILLLLADGPRSALEISEQMGLDSSAVAEHMSSTSSQGLVRYDQDRESYALTQSGQGSDKLVSYYIDPDACKACLICYRKCPSKSIDGAKKKIHIINQDECGGCGTCFDVCPPNFGAVKRMILGATVPAPIPEAERMLQKATKA